MPALTGQGGSMAVGFFGPCGFNPPHVHPRSSEIFIVTEGQITTAAFPENGAAAINQTLNAYQMTIFPQGSVHTQFNTGCGNATFVASLPSEDPGVGGVVTEFLGLDSEVVAAALGSDVTIDGKDLESFRNALPKGVALGVESCLQKCNISKREL
jgi:oxalate decarboxylase/phosphoglucose isomerase-like protein (cupin superfamily)